MRRSGRQSWHAAASLSLAASATVAVLLSCAPASAGEIGYPKAASKIQLRVPDDWVVSESGLGLELEAPRKDSLVVAAVLPRDKAKVDAWVQQAVGRMKAEGVSFLAEGDRGSQMPAEAFAPKLEPPSDPSATSSTGETFTFSGAPAIGKAAPPSEQDYLPQEATKYGLPPSAMATGKGAALSPFSQFYYKSTTMHGTPVDIELALYALGKTQVFVIEQMSGPIDPRGVMIVRSLRVMG